MNLENLYGQNIQDESKIIRHALVTAVSGETSHPDDRDKWSSENPAYGHCDLFTDYCRRIWGKKTEGKTNWNPEAHILVWWAYANYQTFSEGLRKNKLTVHYSFEHPTYGEIDLSRDQFPSETYLHPRPYPLTHIVPIQRGWDITSDMNNRKKILDPGFLSNLFKSTLPAEITPELDRFLEYHHKSE